MLLPIDSIIAQGLRTQIRLMPIETGLVTYAPLFYIAMTLPKVTGLTAMPMARQMRVAERRP
jgi:hypothetical protein